jgi:hypothetical protein
MKIQSHHWFCSPLFPVIPGEDQETNPLIFGQNLANWLKHEFIKLGYLCAEVIAEDSHWCVMLQRQPFFVWIGCNAVPAAEWSTAETFVPTASEIVWHCFVVGEVPFFRIGSLVKQLRGTMPIRPVLEQVDAQLSTLLAKEDSIQLVPPPQIEWTSSSAQSRR